ncbi:Longin-like domain-containing protein [Cynara cardunculus var. scolymus]|uniref:Coatomer subunit zeta n=1 Tax=Cynara cardunculus var. scolymus TaxID=59895 RepID=A0A118JSA9_CYNCS|nr:Longin-like domain-containing protein [Cynara cardunculus var. scolymus]
MLLAVLIANSEGNILVERFNGVPGEERLHWRSFLVKLGADNLKGVKNEELLVACHKYVFTPCFPLTLTTLFSPCVIKYAKLLIIFLYCFNLVSEAMFVVTSAIKDVCGKPPTERLFLDKYGRICLCLDEIVWKGLLENTDKDRIKRLIRLKPPTEF